MNVDESLERWSGWALVAYAVLWAWIWYVSVPSEPAALVDAVLKMGAFALVYWFLVDRGFDRLYATGGLYRRAER